MAAMAIDLRPKLIEDGFDIVCNAWGAEVMDRFYDLLFDCGLAFRFEGQEGRGPDQVLHEQKPKLLKVLFLLRNSVRDLRKLKPALMALGDRHRELGILPHEYLAVGYCLVRAFDEVAANHGFEGWAEAYSETWTAVYMVLVDVMVYGDDIRIRHAETMEKVEVFVNHHNSLVEKVRNYGDQRDHAIDCRVRRFFRLSCDCGLTVLRSQLPDKPLRTADLVA